MSKPTAEQFAKDVAKHEMTILHDDGVYRHITFGVPDSGIDRFNLTTFPGRLVFTGDRGDYLFERIDDMFKFFRRGDGGINPRYWSEKCVAADRDGIRKFSAERFEEVIRQHLEDIEADAATRETVEEELLSSVDELTDESAHAAVSEFEIYDHEEPAGVSFVEAQLIRAERYSRTRRQLFRDSCEFDFTEYTYRFIWCLRAIVWGISKYDSRN